MALKILTIFIISICLSVNSEFPGDLKLCKYGDLECIKATIDLLFKDNSEDARLPQLHPLNIGNVYIQQTEGSPVSLDLLLKDSHIEGFDTAHVVKVKGFGKDLTEKHGIHIHADYLSTVGGYEVNGKILILPITGSGKSNITMVEVDVYLNFVGKAVEKDGATYMEVDQMNIDAKPQKMIYDVQNLFNGDKALGDNMNLFLNENWQEVFTEVRDSLNREYGKVFTEAINSVFSQRPYDQLFTE